MALLNVRLDEDDVLRAKALRDAGVPISTLVRDAIRAEYERRVLPKGPRTRPSKIVAGILASLPDPPDMPAPTLDITDRHAVRRHIAAKLRRTER